VRGHGPGWEGTKVSHTDPEDKCFAEMRIRIRNTGSQYGTVLLESTSVGIGLIFKYSTSLQLGSAVFIRKGRKKEDERNVKKIVQGLENTPPLLGGGIFRCHLGRGKYEKGDEKKKENVKEKGEKTQGKVEIEVKRVK
jgi:hypothetical protein